MNYQLSTAPYRLPSRRDDRVLHQHGDGHRPHTARNGRDERGAFLGGGELDVSDEATAVGPVDADVDHHTTRPNPVAADHLGAPDGGDQHTCTPYLVREVARARMTHRQRRVTLQEHEGHGLTDERAAPSDHGARAFQFDAGAVDEPHDAQGRARPHTLAALDQTRLAEGVQAVNVLRRIDRFNDDVGVDVPRQRQLYENAVDVTALIQRLDQTAHVRLGRRRRQLVGRRHDAKLRARLALAAHVTRRPWIVADEDGRQARRVAELALKRRDLLEHLRAYRSGDALPVDDLAHACGHTQSAPRCKQGESPAVTH